MYGDGIGMKGEKGRGENCESDALLGLSRLHFLLCRPALFLRPSTVHIQKGNVENKISHCYTVNEQNRDNFKQRSTARKFATLYKET